MVGWIGTNQRLTSDISAFFVESVDRQREEESLECLYRNDL